ncbi:MAG: alpha/beta hydrolase [Alphaproteobacteria bacterium]|nr:alpha/beta hydrolase [Alphaproteobacteria bacterium]
MAAPAPSLVEVGLDGARVPLGVHVTPCTEGPRLVWLHGWGQDHRAFAALQSFFAGEAEHVGLDMPGFGIAPPPPGDWSTQDYGRLLGAYLATLAPRPTVLVGHSFGVRVILRLAAAGAPGWVARLVLIAGAGLQRRRSAPARLRAAALKLLGRAARLADRLLGTKLHAAYAARFGSADYRKAGPLRGTFVKVVTEDQSDTAARVKLPTLLLYGEKDTETPPEFGTRYRALIAGSTLRVLPGLDHYSVLGTSAHQVKSALRAFLKEGGLL